MPLRARRVRRERGSRLQLTAGAYSRAFSALRCLRALLCGTRQPTLTPLARGALRSMADATEAQQLAAVAAARLQRDVASIARLTRAATSAAVCQASCSALSDILSVKDCLQTLEESQLAAEALLSALHVQPASAGVQCEACLGLALMCIHAAEARAVAGAAGAVEVVAALLQANAEVGDVVDAACTALSGMVWLSSENCGRAHRAGALDALLVAMRAYPTQETCR